MKFAAEPHGLLIRKLKAHSRLSKSDLDEIRSLKLISRELGADEDIVRQGDRPNVSVLVVGGVVARYHLLPSGRRQYLAFHFAGDMPDSQAIFVDRMDHAVCAMGTAQVVSIKHRDLLAAFQRQPSLSFAIWRETLIDAAIFREAITNNSARSTEVRTAHLLCELFYRSRALGLADRDVCNAPITLEQWGDALGMSLATVNRSLSEIRKTGYADFRNGQILVRDWERLIVFAEFNPAYLHLKQAPM
jgi:CRP-like cAMP-binding protein